MQSGGGKIKKTVKLNWRMRLRSKMMKWSTAFTILSAMVADIVCRDSHIVGDELPGDNQPGISWDHAFRQQSIAAL